MFFFLSVALAECPLPLLSRTLSEDGAAWEIRGDGEKNCLLRTDDRDDTTLIKQWSGPANLLPLEEGVLLLAERWVMVTDSTDSWRIPLIIPETARSACFNLEQHHLVIATDHARWSIQVENGTVTRENNSGPGCG